VFLMWRMKGLINNGKIEVTGDLGKSWKDFDVKLMDAKSSSVAETEEATI